MRGQSQARALRLVIAPARGRVSMPGRSRAAKRKDEQLVVMARLAEQRRAALRSGRQRPEVMRPRLPY